jgi:16S rRNA (adenine1518-N6/adenine1519-N6)-dimethyltransferase
VEIGPGRGALTTELLKRVGPTGKLIAVEVDRDLAAMLRLQYADHPAFSLIEGDVLDTDFSVQVKQPFLLVGNIPYNITTPILFRALEHPRAERTVFLVQLEVAERLAANPGTKEYGALSVNAQALARLEIVFKVPAGAFSPPPKVESAVIRMTPLPTPVLALPDEAGYRRLVQALFSHRRKQMLRAVRSVRGLDAYNAGAALEKAGINPTARPEVLTPAQFAQLQKALNPR